MQDEPQETTVPLLDLQRQNQPLRDEIIGEIGKVYDSGRFLYGPQVAEFESAMAERIGVSQTVGCASCSDALLLALMALGVGPGDEVIVPSFTFFATASAVVRLGAVPVFVDIDPNTFNIDPALIESCITSKSRAIIPVHLFGQCAPMDPILEIASRHGLPVIEDAAQAVDATCGGRVAGSMGNIGCFSFYPTKNLGGMGDGGLLSVDDDKLASRLRKLAAHGMEPRYYHSEIGINSRLDTFQAAVLGIKLQHLKAWAEGRRVNARRYDELLTAADLDGSLTLPQVTHDDVHVWNQYTIRVSNGRRDQLKSWLAENKIGSEVYYPVPLHQQECMQGKCHMPYPLPHTEQFCQEVLSLPNFAEITVEQATLVVETCRSFFKGATGQNAASTLTRSVA